MAPCYLPRMPFVPLRDGRSLHVRVLGRGEPVLLLPGLGMNSTHWLPFIVPFAHRYRFHLPDFRGFGRSSHLRIEHEDVFESHANDVRDVIAHFGLRDFLLGGISLGGTTALHMNRDGGLAGVRRYLHIDQSPCVGNRPGWNHGLFGERQEELFAEMRAVLELLARHEHAEHLSELPAGERQRAADVLAKVVAMIGGDEGRAGTIRRAILLPRPISRHLPLSHLDDVRTYLGAYAGGGHDYRPALRECRTPITVMVGMNSPLYAPAGQMAIADYAPDVRIVRFERSGHVPLVDQPLAFMRELGRFLAGS